MKFEPNTRFPSGMDRRFCSNQSNGPCIKEATRWWLFPNKFIGSKAITYDIVARCEMCYRAQKSSFSWCKELSSDELCILQVIEQ